MARRKVVHAMKKGGRRTVCGLGSRITCKRCLFSRQNLLRLLRVRRQASGFMLLELIISIAILTVMLAVALPNVALAQQAAQKQNAVQMLRTQALQATQQCLSTGYTIHSQGYTFSFLPLGCDANNTYTLTWAMTADPITGSANQTHYYVDQGPPTLTIRYSNGSPATAASNPI